MEASKKSARCQVEQLALCEKDLCPAFCYEKYEKLEQNKTHLIKECILRCVDGDLCTTTGLSTKDETALDDQLREQMIVCMKEIPPKSVKEEADEAQEAAFNKTQNQGNAPVTPPYKAEWKNFKTPEFKIIYDRGAVLLNESKRPKKAEEDEEIQAHNPKNSLEEKVIEKKDGPAVPMSSQDNESQEKKALPSYEVFETTHYRRLPIESIIQRK